MLYKENKYSFTPETPNFGTFGVVANLLDAVYYSNCNAMFLETNDYNTRTKKSYSL